MKKLILIITLMAGVVFSASSQSVFKVGTFTDLDTSFINSTPEYSTFTYDRAYDNVVITPVVTKNSGTVTGCARLYGSVDGTTYHIITSATDSIAWTNTAGAQQNGAWNLGPTTPKYKYLKVKFQGYGTMNAYYYVKTEYYGK